MNTTASQSTTASTAVLLDQAAATCSRQGARLTEIRRRVLGLVLEGRGPMGAYALLDRLKAERANATPVTVYRALGFLLDHGLIHKIERLNAFVACSEPGDHRHSAHAAQFLICGRCGTVAELEDGRIAAEIARVAGAAGFSPSRATVEVEGVCAVCAAAGSA